MTDQETCAFCGQSTPDNCETKADLAVCPSMPLGFRWEHRDGDDGAGSSPANPATDRPSTKWVRLVGPWRRMNA